MYTGFTRLTEPQSGSDQTRSGLEAHAHVLDFKELFDAVLGAFPSDAGFLHAAKRRNLSRNDAGVDADDAAFKAFADTPDSTDVPGIEVRSQAKLRIVCHGYTFFFRFEAEEWSHRTEGLLPHDLHVRCDIGQYGWLEEGASQGMGRSADQHLRAFGDRIRNVLLHLFNSGLVNQGPLRDPLFETRPDLQGLDLLRQFFGKGVIDTRLNDDAVRADTGLTHVAVLAQHRSFDGRIQVGIIEHKKRRVSAKLHGDLLHGRGRLFHQNLSDLGGTREGNFSDDRVRGQFAPDLPRRTRQDIDHARRDTRLLGQFSHCQGGVRGLGGGLYHDGAASRERWTCLAGDHGIGEVPGGDRSDNANRLLDNDDSLVALVRRNYVAIDALRFLCKPLDEGSAIGDLSLGF